MSKTKILIDGENFRHQVAHVLQSSGKLKDKNGYFKFDLSGFLAEALQQKNPEIVYYTTRIKQPRQKIPAKLQKRINDISKANRRWVADLTNQGIHVVKAGYLRVRESSVCVHCGKTTLGLQEKGVDVRVATDLVLAAHDKDQQSLVLGSSDSDIAPAIEAAGELGLKTTYLCYAGWLNRSVAAQADKTITFDDALVLKYYKGNQ